MRTARHPPAPEVVVATAIAMVSATFVGCAPPPAGPPEKYFGGRTVDDWLVTIETGNPRDRKRAADMLGNVGPVAVDAVPALQITLQDTDAVVRSHAAAALDRIQPARAENAAETR